MPYADPTRQAEYQRDWMAKRRAEWFADKVCAGCGSAEELELDHQDPSLKVSHRIWSWSRPRREAELAKCRPLCSPCHQRKSSGEVARGENKVKSVKLSGAQVIEIKASSLSCRVLGEQYGVHFVTISKIKRGVLWAHLD
jgi:hypothetical protein